MPRRGLLTGDDTSIIARLVGCDEFLERPKESRFSKSASADIRYKLVVVMQHVEDQSRTSLFTGRHPTSLPLSERIDLLMHRVLIWKDVLSGDEIAEPTRLKAVGENAGNGRGIPDKGEPRRVRNCRSSERRPQISA